MRNIRKNKKASGLGDIYVIFIFLVVTTLVAGLSLFMFSQFNESWQNTTGNVGERSQEETDEYNTTMSVVLDGGIILWLTILIFGSWVTSFFLDNTPVFFIIFLLLSMMSFFVLPPFANIQSDISETAISEGYDHLPMTMFINDNLILFMIAYIVGIFGSLYLKTRVLA